MKKSILTLTWIFATAFLFSGTIAQENKAVALGGAEISLDKEVHDYGKIEQHANGTCVFTVTNTGSEDLVISRCKGSCGCTVPECSTDPIAPGAKREIKVKYDTKRIGPINKSVTITSNAVNSPTKIVRIKGEIKAPNATATPVKPVQGPVSSPAE
ncbi:MAG: hypothetical protein CL846_00010 [Crocinitomicaceae bacterium]|nr:hypothetical protein [Crocinitomicaceae bacterium]|tara:strand:+ start:14474 stop:14941 length:468 start_codon:yes stop_codon:yes gene_type:complete